MGHVQIGIPAPQQKYEPAPPLQRDMCRLVCFCHENRTHPVRASEFVAAQLIFIRIFLKCFLEPTRDHARISEPAFGVNLRVARVELRTLSLVFLPGFHHILASLHGAPGSVRDGSNQTDQTERARGRVSRVSCLVSRVSREPGAVRGVEANVRGEVEQAPRLVLE